MINKRTGIPFPDLSGKYVHGKMDEGGTVILLTLPKNGAAQSTILCKILRRSCNPLQPKNAINSILIVLGSIFRFTILYPLVSPIIKIALRVVYFVYLMTNPFVYMFVMVDLRKEYKKQVCRIYASMNVCNNNRVHPQQ